MHFNATSSPDDVDMDVPQDVVDDGPTSLSDLSSKVCIVKEWDHYFTADKLPNQSQALLLVVPTSESNTVIEFIHRDFRHVIWIPQK